MSSDTLRSENPVLRSLSSPTAIVLLATLLLLVAGELLRPGFAHPGQLVSLARIAAFLGFIAAGQTLIILAGNDGIDLSVGSIVTAAAIIVYTVAPTYGLPAGMIAAVAMGAFVGLINGVGVTVLGLPPLIMTLGMSGVVRGLVLVLTGGRPSGSESLSLTAFVTQPWIAGISGTVFLWIALGVVMHLVMTRNAWGKAIYAIGANVNAARLSGIPTDAGRILIYSVAGALASVGGVVLLGYTGSVFLNLGEPYTLQSIAAVVVGGTLLAGGVGSYWGTMAGALMLTVLQSFLIVLGLPEFGRQIVYGLLLAIVLCIYAQFRRKRG